MRNVLKNEQLNQTKKNKFWTSLKLLSKCIYINSKFGYWNAEQITN